MRHARGRTDIEVHTSGMGRKNAEAAISKILAAGHPRHVFTVGVAGALHPDLKVGDVVFETADLCLAGALIALGAKQVKFVTTEHVLLTAEERRRLREKTGGDVVENESGFVQAMCRTRGVPCTTIRTISDTANQDLPFDFNKLTGPDGNVSYCKVIGAVLRKPSALPALIRLAIQTNKATKSLSNFLQRALPRP